ncbi:MAG TPA: tetratricopeptide repeat protein [Xanthomonadales bacterium]|nr:tetratricopeptide repeat protein [Xanthomonadales bacterium]
MARALAGRKTLPLALCLLLAAAGPVYAQENACKPNRNAGTGTLDELTWKQLNSIYETVGEERYDEAYESLRKLLNRAGRDRYLQAILNQALAQVEWSRGRYEQALGYFETAVELDALPDEAHYALMYQIAQLYFMQDRYDAALEKLELWFCTVPAEKVTSAAYVLKASIHARKEDYPRVLEAIGRAIAMDPDPKEPWYQLKLAAHYELEQYPQAAETLGVLITNWPDKKVYWIQLSQIHHRLKQDERALAVLALAYRKGLLDKQTDITYLSSLYSNANVHYKAAEVLEKGIRDGIVQPGKLHWTMVADAWYAAEELEKSLRAYDEAGKLADEGLTDLRRGYILVDLERWAAALEALDRALEKGGLDERQAGEAYLLRGMARFNLGDYDAATRDWTQAGRHEKTRAAARQWLNHLEEERRRRAS